MLLGDEESPLPNMLGTIMKYFSGLSVMSGPMSQSFSQCLPAKGSRYSTSQSARHTQAWWPQVYWSGDRMLTCEPGRVDYGIALVGVQGPPGLVCYPCLRDDLVTDKLKVSKFIYAMALSLSCISVCFAIPTLSRCHAHSVQRPQLGCSIHKFCACKCPTLRQLPRVH